MARPREFDTDTALEGALNVFWSHGYEGAALPELLKGMGLTRGSLYKAFSGKKALFLTVLERYEGKAVSPAIALLSDSEIKNGLDRIGRLFAVVAEAVRSGDHRGCILCTAAAGPTCDDEEIADVVHQLLGKMRDGFETALSHSKRHATFDDAARRDLANLLLTHYIGLRILARSHAPVDRIEGSIVSLMSLLDRK